MSAHAGKSLAAGAAFISALAAMSLLTSASAQPDPVATGITRTLNVPYGHDGTDPLLLDAYWHNSGDSSATVMLVHGGGFYGGSKEVVSTEAEALAQSGYAVFNVDYSLDRELGPAYPRQIHDVQAAISWVRANGASYNADINRLGVVGASAGGYLAAMAVMLPAQVPGVSASAVISLSGPMDIYSLVAEARRTHPNTTQDSLQLDTLLGCGLRTCADELLRAASPITHVRGGLPPFLLLNSKQEQIPAAQATRMAARLRAAGDVAETIIVPGNAHAEQYLPATRAQISAFLQTHVQDALPLATAPSLPFRSNKPVRSMNDSWHWPVVAPVLVMTLVAGVGAGALVTRWRKMHE